MRRLLLLLLAACLAVGALAGAEGYKIRVGDELSVKVREAPELNGDYLVAEDGTIVFPEVGIVKAAGRTVAEVARDIRKGLEGGYLARASVQVVVSRYTPVRYYVLGRVRNPGAFEMEPGIPVTLLQALAFAGGLTEDADPSRIKIIRKNENTFTVDLAPAFSVGDASNDILVREGDIVIVLKKQDRFAYVFGAVGSPGRIDFPGESDSLPLGAVVALAGGFRELTDGEIQIFPPNPSGDVRPQVIPLGETGLTREAFVVPVKPRQTVFVLDRKTKIYVLGKVRKPGPIPYRKGLTILEAVALAGGLAEGSAENRTKLITSNPDGTKKVAEINLSKLLSADKGDSIKDIELSPRTIIVVPESRF